MSSTRLVAATITAAGVLLAGCGSGPSRVNAAAIIGDTVISVETVKQRVEALAALRPQTEPEDEVQLPGQPPNAKQPKPKRDETGRRMAATLVGRELTKRFASSEGISVSDEEIRSLINNAGGVEALSQRVQGTLDTADTAADRLRDQLLCTALGRKYIDKLAITFDFVSVKDRNEALTTAAEMSAGEQRTKEVVNKALAANPKAGKLNQFAHVADEPSLGKVVLFGVKPGTVVAFPASQLSDEEDDTAGGRWFVARVKKRETDAKPISPAPNRVDPRILEMFGQRLASMYAAETTFEISPRYGVWDPAAVRPDLRIVSNPAVAAGLVLTGPEKAQ